jgi:hypothetical protein
MLMLYTKILEHQHGDNMTFYTQPPQSNFYSRFIAVMGLLVVGFVVVVLGLVKAAELIIAAYQMLL